MAHSIRLHRLLLAVAVFSSFSLTVVIAPPAGAQNGQPCDAPVAADVGTLDEGSLAAVRDAAAELEALTGAVVRVRVVDHLPGGEPERYLGDALDQCSSWAKMGGDRRDPQLVAVIVGLDDRATGLFYGSSMRRLDPVEKSIQEFDMNPRFADGDVAGGLVAGLEAAGAALAGTPHPRSTDTNSDTGGGDVAVPWATVGVVAGLIALAALTAVAVWFTVRVLRRRARRKRALAEFTSRRSSVADRIYTCGEALSELRNELLVAAPHPDDQERLRASLAAVQSSYDRVAVELGEVAVPALADCSDDMLVTVDGELDAVEAAFAKVDADRARLAETGAALVAFASTAEAELQARRDRLEEIGAAVAAADADGFDVSDHRIAAAAAAAAVDAAADAIGDDRRLQAIDAFNDADSRLVAAADAATLSGRFTAAAAARSRHDAAIGELYGELVAADAVLDALGRKWASVALEGARTARRDAGDGLDAARESLAGIDPGRERFNGGVEEALAGVGEQIAGVRRQLAAVRGADGALTATLDAARSTFEKAESRRSQVNRHPQGSTVSSRSFNVAAGAFEGGPVDPFEAQRLAAAALSVADKAWNDAEAARRREEDAEREEARRREAARAAQMGSSSGGSSSSWGGGSSGGGSSSKW